MQTVSHERHLHVTTLSPVFAPSYNFTAEWRGSRPGMVHNILAGEIGGVVLSQVLYLRSTQGVPYAGLPQGFDRSSLRGL